MQKNIQMNFSWLTESLLANRLHPALFHHLYPSIRCKVVHAGQNEPYPLASHFRHFGNTVILLHDIV